MFLSIYIPVTIASLHFNLLKIVVELGKFTIYIKEHILLYKNARISFKILYTIFCNILYLPSHLITQLIPQYDLLDITFEGNPPLNSA